jgi:hypothetical protein
MAGEGGMSWVNLAGAVVVALAVGAASVTVNATDRQRWLHSKMASE